MYTSAIIFAEICFFWVNGLIIEWGYKNFTDSTGTHTWDYPITGIKVLFGTTYKSSNLGSGYIERAIFSSNGVTLYQDYFASSKLAYTLYWLVIGTV